MRQGWAAWDSFVNAVVILLVTALTGAFDSFLPRFAAPGNCCAVVKACQGS